MKSSTFWTSVTATGLIAGYVTTCAQLTPGYGQHLAHLRGKIRGLIERKTEEAQVKHQPQKMKDWYSLSQLVDCGWCLSPYTTLPVWALVARINRIRGIQWLVGYAASVALTAIVRHYAEVM